MAGQAAAPLVSASAVVWRRRQLGGLAVRMAVQSRPMSDADPHDGDVPVRSRRRRTWLSLAAVAACLLGVMIWLVDPFDTEAQRYVSQVSVRGYERVDDYIDPGTAPAEDRAAVAVFVGPPDDNLLSRVSGPDLVVNAPTKDLDWPETDLIGDGDWHGCFVLVERWKAHASPPPYVDLTAEQRAAFHAGRLSVLSIAVGCGGSPA